MEVFRSLVVIWFLPMISIASFNTAYNLDGRYAPVKRDQVAPWELTFGVPRKSCILTAKLGKGPIRYLPDEIHSNNLLQEFQLPAQSNIVPLNRIFKRRLHVKRHATSSPGLLHVINSLDRLGDYYAKRPAQILKRKWRPRRLRKRLKRIRHNYMLTSRSRGERTTRLPKLVLTRRTKWTEKTSLPKFISPLVTKRPRAATLGVTAVAKTLSKTTYLEILNTKEESPLAPIVDLEAAALTTPLQSKSYINSTIVADLWKIATFEEVSTTPPTSPNIPEVMTVNLQDETTATPFGTHAMTKIHNYITEEATKIPETFSNMEFTKEPITTGVSKVHTSLTLSPQEQTSGTGSETVEAFTQTPPIITISSTLDNTINTTTSSFTTKLPESTKGILRKIPTKMSASYTNRVPISQQAFAQALDQFERKFYNATFGKLSSICPPDRRENGISFVESGLFLYSILTALCLEGDPEFAQELRTILDLNITTPEKLNIMRHILDSLPESGNDLKLRWSTRLLVNGSWTPSSDILDKLRIQVERIDRTATPEQLMKSLNHKVEEDSGGAMRNTFEEDELANGASGVLMNTLYLRARWRSAPTLLNGTRAFRDAAGAPPRTARMIRINDVMNYAFLPEWDAEAVEISYATPGLSLLLLVPRGLSLRGLSEVTSAVSLSKIIDRMRKIRVAVVLPIYTLRMTLLLPNKLEAMGISRLIDVNAKKEDNLRLSHAVQRIMFWAEAGRNAFKDDGIEWDEATQLEMLVDRPYLFYVRWCNVTLMNGNFVL